MIDLLQKTDYFFQIKLLIFTFKDESLCILRYCVEIASSFIKILLIFFSTRFYPYQLRK